MTSAARSEKGLRKAVTFANDARLLYAKMQGGIAPLRVGVPEDSDILQHWPSLRTNSKGKVK